MVRDTNHIPYMTRYKGQDWRDHDIRIYIDTRKVYTYILHIYIYLIYAYIHHVNTYIFKWARDMYQLWPCLRLKLRWRLKQYNPLPCHTLCTDVKEAQIMTFDHEKQTRDPYPATLPVNHKWLEYPLISHLAALSSGGSMGE